MNPTFWGPHGWIFLHSITFNYPTEPNGHDKQVHIDFFNSLQHVLPCEKCAHHYSQHISKYPVEDAVKDRDTFIRWLIKIHNLVNESLGKRTWTYEEVIDDYKSKMSSGTDETMIYKVVILALLVFIGYHIYNKNITLS